MGGNNFLRALGVVSIVITVASLLAAVTLLASDDPMFDRQHGLLCLIAGGVFMTVTAIAAHREAG